jgi:uncharacterized protein (DUF1778 family)
MPEAIFNLRLDDEDRTLLEACAAREKLTLSDTVRRAIRSYARELGVTAEAKKKRERRSNR